MRGNGYDDGGHRGGGGALWSRIAKNPDVSTGPLALPFAHSLVPFTHLLAPHCSLHSRATLHSLVRLLTYSRSRGKKNDSMAILVSFFLFWTIVWWWRRWVGDDN